MTGHHSFWPEFGSNPDRIGQTIRQIASVFLAHIRLSNLCKLFSHTAKKKNNFHRRLALRGCMRVASFVCHLWQPLILHFCCTMRVYSLCGMTSTSALLHSLTGIFVAKLIAQIVLNVLLQAASFELDKQRAF